MVARALKTAAKAVAVVGLGAGAVVTYETVRLRRQYQLETSSAYHAMPSLSKNPPPPLPPYARLADDNYVYARVPNPGSATSAAALGKWVAAYNTVAPPDHAETPEVYRTETSSITAYTLPLDIVEGAARVGIVLPSGGLQELSAVCDGNDVVVSVGSNAYLAPMHEGKHIGGVMQFAHDTFTMFMVDRARKLLTHELQRGT